jgi:hypothetical protein
LGSGEEEENTDEWYYEEEETEPPVYEWEANQSNTGANLPIDEVAAKALEIGREDGGFFARIGLFFGKRDIPLELSFDDVALESLLKTIDSEIGDPRPMLRS